MQAGSKLTGMGCHEENHCQRYGRNILEQEIKEVEQLLSC